MSQTSKVCKECAVEKPIGEFYRNCGHTDGRLNICKVCFNVARRRRDREPHGRRLGWLRDAWRATKKRAEKHGVPHTIARGDISLPSHCPVLGIRLEPRGPLSDASPTVDRIIPELGYVPGNVIVVSSLVNRIKSNAAPQEILQVGLFYAQLIQQISNEENTNAT